MCVQDDKTLSEEVKKKDYRPTMEGTAATLYNAAMYEQLRLSGMVR
jgi:hypothetical protein